ncbi:MAG: glycosyltransferase family 39 protein [Thermoguttaceae bacterium]
MRPSRRRWLVLLLIVAFAIRLAVGLAWQTRLSGRFGLGDSESYWQLGRAIAEGKPYEYGPEHARIFRTPGYPLLLAPILRLAGDGWAGLLLGRAEAALFGTLAVLAIWWLARLLFDDRAASIAAILATFYPGAVALSVLILSEAPFCPLMLLQIGLWVLAARAKKPWPRAGWGFAAGLTAGAATLMRPSWLLFTPLAAVAFVLSQCGASNRSAAAGTAVQNDPGADVPSTAKRHAVAVAAAMLLGLVVAMTPWWVRNARVTGRFVPTTLQVGASLYDGLSPNATGASNLEFADKLKNRELVFLSGGQAKPRRAGESWVALEQRLDRQMRDAALDWAKSHPDRVLQLAGVKFLRMWNLWPNEPQLARNWAARWAVVFTYTPLLILAIMGVWRTLDRGWPYILCWLPAVYLTSLHLVFVSSLRYREPAMLALLVLAAGEMTDWGSGIRGWWARRRLRV